MTTPNVEVKANRFIGAKIKKNIKFMGQDLEIAKLTVNQVLGIQELAKEVQEGASEETNLKLLMYVIRVGAEDLSELTMEQFKEFPMDELSKLSEEIMKYSGLGKQSS